MAVSKHFLASILAQFADRRLFLYLFGHNLGTKAEVIFTAIAESLVKPEGEGEGGEREERKLSPSSPMKYLFQVCTMYVLATMHNGLCQRSMRRACYYF